MSSQTIGKVTATESRPTTCDVVRFWIDDDVILRPFDIVKIDHLHDSHTYAIVQGLHHMTDSPGHLASYVSSDFGSLQAEPLNKRLGTTVAEAHILFNTKEIEMPLRNGARVEWADIDGIRRALGLDSILQGIPGGWIETSNGQSVPIEFDARYLIGPEGAHLNIAGISGMAAKTSYVMFLLNSIYQSIGGDVSIVLFNVKGSDLLAIDRDPEALTDKVRDQWGKCALSPTPFRNVVYLYPFANRPHNCFTNSHNAIGILREQYEQGIASNYYYDVSTVRDYRILPLIFADVEDPTGTMESVFQAVCESDAFDRDSWGAFRSEVRQRTQAGQRGGRDISVQSWRKFSRILRTRTQGDLFTEKSVQAERFQELVFDSVIKHLPERRVIVVDIEPLPAYLQALVVGDVVNTIYRAKLGDFEEDVAPRELGKVIVFADELNKYAPKGSQSGGGRALTSTLLEITERGRSLGVVLFGAEQFRSGVHDRVLGNCSTNAYGRTSPVEIQKCADYRHFPDAYKATVARLPQGQLLLQHAVFRTHLIRTRFPEPCYYQPKA